MNNIDLIVSEHGLLRFKQRAGIKNYKTAHRFAVQAFTKGQSIKEESTETCKVMLFNNLIFIFALSGPFDYRIITLVTLIEKAKYFRTLCPYLS